MATSAQFYLQQAAICEEAAGAALLDNQRDTLQRSRAAWLALATRELEVQAARIKRDQEREQDRAEAHSEEPIHAR